MCSLVLSDTSASGVSDKDHAHVFFKSHTMVLLKIKGLAYLLQYTAQIMDNHSCDGLLSCTLYTRHLLFYPSIYSDSTGMLSYSDLDSSLPQLDLYSCTSFPLAAMLPIDPHPDFGIYAISRDTSSVETKK
jgi:hypothetical protein